MSEEEWWDYDSGEWDVDEPTEVTRSVGWFEAPTEAGLLASVWRRDELDSLMASAHALDDWYDLRLERPACITPLGGSVVVRRDGTQAHGIAEGYTACFEPGWVRLESRGATHIAIAWK